MTAIDLSICIPTYNRSAKVHRLVERILKVADPRLQVVVSDNGSTDDTLGRLGEITDSRLKVHANGENRGVLYNALNVLEQSRGRFAALLLDKDDIDPDLIPDFKRFLLTNESLACGYCRYHSVPPAKTAVHFKGMAALRHVAYVGHHPTGYFFETRLLRSVDFVRRFSSFAAVGHFPFDFIFAELALLGDAAVYHAPVFSPETAETAAKHKSLGTNASTEDAFFSPKGRLRTAIGFSQHIKTLAIPAGQKTQLIAERFVRGLVDSTVGYREIMANPDLCTHYHIESRAVGAQETAVDALRFYRRFVAEVTGSSSPDSRPGIVGLHLGIARSAVGRLLRGLQTR